MCHRVHTRYNQDGVFHAEKEPWHPHRCRWRTQIVSQCHFQLFFGGSETVAVALNTVKKKKKTLKLCGILTLSRGSLNGKEISGLWALSRAGPQGALRGGSVVKLCAQAPWSTSSLSGRCRVARQKPHGPSGNQIDTPGVTWREGYGVNTVVRRALLWTQNNPGTQRTEDTAWDIADVGRKGRKRRSDEEEGEEEKEKVAWNRRLKQRERTDKEEREEEDRVYDDDKKEEEETKDDEAEEKEEKQKE